MSASTPRRRWAPFVALEVATLLSAVGNGIAMIALPWLVLELTGKASDAGLVAAAGALPLLGTALFAGTVVDRVGRRRTSVVSDALSALSVAAIPVVGAFGHLTLTWLMALAALGAFFDPAGATARLTMLPAVARLAGMRPEKANGIHEAIFNTAYLVGPGVGGLLIAFVGPETTLWATAGAFLAAGVTMLFVRVPGGASPTDLAARAGFWAETMEGLRFVWNARALRTLAFIYLAVVALWLPIEGVVLPVLFQSEGRPQALGLLLTAMSAGMVVGTLLYGFVGHRLHRRTAVLVALGGTALPLIAMALLPALPWMLVLGFLSGLLFGPVNPIINVVMQERSPERMRGRVLGVFTSSAYAAGPLGLLLAGPLVDHLGVQGAFMVLALALTVLGLGTIALPGLRDIDRPATELVAAEVCYAEVHAHSEPPRGRGKGDSKPPAGRPTSRHDSPTPVGSPKLGPRRSRRSRRPEKPGHRGGSDDS